MAECPRCSKPLKFNDAKSCECGWKKRERPEAQSTEPRRMAVDCAYAACRDDATIRVKAKTGWANLCKNHYAMHTLAEAKSYTAGLGLKTRDELMAFCRKKQGEIGKGKMHGEFLKNYLASQPKRDAGEDLEEAA